MLAICARLEGQGEGRRRAGDRRQPVPEHAARQAGGHPGDRGERDRLLPEPGAARVSGGGGPVRLGRVRLFGDGREHRRRLGRQAVRAVFRRGGARPGRRRSGLQPAVSDVCAQPRAPRGTGRACAAQGRERVSPVGRGRPALPRHRSQTAGDLPQLAAQPDRRRGDARGPGRDRRRGARHRADGLFRRALLPHGLERPARVDPGRAGHARAHRGGLYLQQVVQHERLADRLRRGGARPSWMRSAS